MKRGIYLLPTMFTMLNLSLGFYAIIAIFNGKFSTAAWSIVACHFCDVLDGRIARMTNSTSSFGIEFDSFADWISFGIAPAIMMHQLVLFKYGRLGFAIALFYVIAGSLRLARFNMKAFERREEIGSTFVGLPIPAAGGMLAAFVLVYEMFYQEITQKTIPLLMKNIPYIYNAMPIVVFLLAICMVSRIRWNNFKAIKLQRPKPFRMLVIAVMFFMLLYIYTENTIFMFYVAYFFWGLVEFFIGLKLFRKRGEGVGTKQDCNI